MVHDDLTAVVIKSSAGAGQENRIRQQDSSTLKIEVTGIQGVTSWLNM
jgi:hypothetical protein